MSARWFAGWIGLTVLLVTTQSAAHWYEVIRLQSVGSILDLERSNGIPDVVSTLAIALAAIAAAMDAALNPPRRRLSGLLMLALAGATLIDLLHRAEAISLRGILVTMVLATVAVLLIAYANRTTSRAQITLLTGLSALVLAIVIGDAPSVIAWLERARGETLAEVEIIIEQGLELVGWCLIAVGLWDGAVRMCRDSAQCEDVRLKSDDLSERAVACGSFGPALPAHEAPARSD